MYSMRSVSASGSSGNVADPLLICTGRGTHRAVRAVLDVNHGGADLPPRQRRRRNRQIIDGEVGMLLTWPGSACYRCPECGRAERFGGRRYRRLLGSGLDVVDISLLPD